MFVIVYSSDHKLNLSSSPYAFTLTVVVVAVVLYFIGIGLKKSETVADKYIPAILGVVGVVICGIYVVATCDLKGTQNIAMAIFTAIVQGILVAGLSNYVNQVFKQLNKAE